MKVVVNSGFGGFGLSHEAVMRMAEIKGITLCPSKDYRREIDRTDPALIKVIEEMGEDVNTWHSSLKILEIPDNVEWCIKEYDGAEWVAEKHRTWGKDD